MGANTVDAWPDWLWFFASTPALFLSARICLVFPATAVGRKVDLQWAWNLSASNGWRLVLVVDLLPWLIAQILGVLSRRNASMYETVILTLIGLIFSAVEVAALSLSYRELTKEEGDSTSSTISGAGAD